VLGHGLPSFESPARWSILAGPTVRPKGPTPSGGHFSTPDHTADGMARISRAQKSQKSRPVGIPSMSQSEGPLVLFAVGSAKARMSRRFFRPRLAFRCRIAAFSSQPFMDLEANASPAERFFPGVQSVVSHPGNRTAGLGEHDHLGLFCQNEDCVKTHSTIVLFTPLSAHARRQIRELLTSV
jgi:hypothetical protein